MVEMGLRYCCFYHPFDKPGFQGQKNLSVHIDQELSDSFSGQYQTVSSPDFSGFPSLQSILRMLHSQLWWRVVDQWRPHDTDRACNVTVVDMIHSVVALGRQNSGDRLVLIGHDSYSLRAWRQLMRTGAGLAFVRSAAAWLGWRYTEFLARRLFDFQFFVSPVDRRVAGHPRRSGILPIPLSQQIREAAGQRRPSSDHCRQKLLVPVAVINPTQNSFDMAAVKTIRLVCPPETEITLWGGGAETLRPELQGVENLRFVTWVEDYVGFLEQFDAVIYPRIVGSGFHTKLAEVLALGIPSLSVDWIAEALNSAGYGGLSTFTGPGDFETAVREFCGHGQNTAPTAMASLPRSADAKHALQPLVERCDELLTSVSDTGNRDQNG
jgi:hypothetical protein